MLSKGAEKCQVYAFFVPRWWGPSGTRHSKTTITRRGNVTYRTVQRRGPWGGSYAPKPLSKGEAKAVRWFFGLLLGCLVVFWPFYRFHGSTEAVVGPIWVVGVVATAVLVYRHRSRSKKAAVPMTTKTPSVAPQAIGIAPPPPVASPRPGPSASAQAPRGQLTSEPPAPSVADELKKLLDLKNAGALTDDEFTAQKAKLLGPT
jgi:hypothetical protein